MKITIKDIARMAGVSQSTVSKILNNYDDVGQKTKEKVLAIMSETGYHPSYSARSLAKQKTNVVGVVYAGKINVSFNHPMFVEVVDSFKKTIGAMGYDLLFFSNEKFSQSEENYLARCRHFQVDGCIIIGGDDIENSINELDQSEIPCIGVDIKLSGKRSGYLMTDNYKVSSKVVEHLYLKGYREIAYIGGSRDNYIDHLRLQAFRKAMKEYGLKAHDEWLIVGDYFEESGYVAMQQLLALEKRPKAVFAASDLMAFGAIRALREAGLETPEDIAVVGCDDIQASKYFNPALTTVRQDKEKMGHIAAYMLVDIMNNQIGSSSVMVDPELIIRGTG